jgi:dihydroorotate dehydrogenase electron transfer subunit
MSTQPVELTIKKIVTENTRVKSFYFDYSLDARPGQYLKIGIPGFGERNFGAVVIDENTFLISVGKAGEATTHLHEMNVGEKLTMTGPYGTHFTLPEKKGRIALVAGGYGMAPLGFLTRVAAESGYTVDLFAGARSSDEFLIYEFFNNPYITLHKTTDDGSAGIKGFVTDGFAQYLEKETPDYVYTVGPAIMEDKIAAMCDAKNLPYQLSVESLANEVYGPVIDNVKYAELKKSQAIS